MKLTAKQQALADLMSEISELFCCAGWMISTEYRLWAFVNDPSDDGDWGQYRIPQSARRTLMDLSNEVGGLDVLG